MKINVNFNHFAKKNVVLLSVTWEGKRIQKSTGISVKSNYWNKNNQTFRANYPNALQLNQVLHNIKDSIEKYYYTAKSNSDYVKKEEIHKIITSILNPAEEIIEEGESKPKPKEKYLLDFFDEFIILKRSSKAYTESTIQKYLTIKMHLQDYERSKRIKLKFEDMNKHFSDNFFSHLVKKKKLLNSTIGKNLKILKTFLFYAQDMKWTDNNDFAKGFSKTLRVYKTDTDTQMAVLNENELKQLEEFLPPTEKLRRIKDLFLIQVYTGLRYSDLMDLKPENISMSEEIISINMIKTKDFLRIPIHSKLKRILLKYDNLELPKYSNQKYNVYLKELCKKAGFDRQLQTIKFSGNERIAKTRPLYEEMTTHTGRRTYITLSLKKGLLPEMIMKITGHRSRSSFQKYINITQNEAVETLKSAWED